MAETIEGTNQPQGTLTAKGIVRDSITVSRDQTLSLAGDVQLAEGAEILLEDGATLLGNGHTIQVFGRFATEGTSTTGAVIEGASLSGKGGTVDIVGTRVEGGELFPSFDKDGFGDKGKLTINQSTIDLNNSISAQRDTAIDGSILKDTVIKADQGATITNTTFIGTSSIEHTSWIDASSLIQGNNFLGDGVKLELSGFFDNEHKISSAGNYWGTTNTGEIEEKIIDGNDDLNIKGTIDLSSTLDKPAVDAPLSLFNIQNPTPGNEFDLFKNYWRRRSRPKLRFIDDERRIFLD